MSTRRLIITALVCGMAILVAGGVFLVRVASDGNALTFLPVGRAATVAGVRATVMGATASAETVDVTVEVDATAATFATPVDVESLWLLVRAGKAPERRTGPVDGTGCRGRALAAGERVRCVVSFAAGEGPNVVSFKWPAGGPVSWRLA